MTEKIGTEATGEDSSPEKVLYPAGFTSEEELRAAEQEPLHPDLVPYVLKGPIGYELDHPLMREIILNSGVCNRIYATKQKFLAEALAEEAWEDAVNLHERPNRLEAFLEHVIGKSGRLVDADVEKRDLATSIWVDSESTADQRAEWSELFAGWAPGGDLLLAREEDRAGFADLPETLTIYRGANRRDSGGWSWTLSEETARWFAQRFFSKNSVLRGVVNKQDVFGYMTDRNEDEILVHFKDVREVEGI